MPPDDGWTSPSDLAEYAYCPRSHWYRHHPPSEGPSPGASVRSRRGIRYHQRALSAEQRRAEHGVAYAVTLAIGVAVVAVGLVWIFHL